MTVACQLHLLLLHGRTGDTFNAGVAPCRKKRIRIGLADAVVLAREFYPEFGAAVLVNLPNYQVYLKLMVNGEVTIPFSAESVQWKARSDDRKLDY